MESRTWADHTRRSVKFTRRRPVALQDQRHRTGDCCLLLRSTTIVCTISYALWSIDSERPRVTPNRPLVSQHTLAEWLWVVLAMSEDVSMLTFTLIFRQTPLACRNLSQALAGYFIAAS